MNREIKYRQPIRTKNGKFKEWFYWGYIDEQWIQCHFQLNGVDTRKESQQFTGLIDKNGKEIYEGDIVQCNPDVKYYREVVFIDGKYNLVPLDWSYKSKKNMMIFPLNVVNTSHPDTLVAGNLDENLIDLLLEESIEKINNERKKS